MLSVKLEILPRRKMGRSMKKKLKGELDVLQRRKMGRRKKKKLKGALVAALQPSTSEQLKVFQFLINI